MLMFEKRRLGLQRNMEEELGVLDSKRSELTNKQYWSEFKQISDKYKKLLDEVYDAEKAFEVTHSNANKPREYSRSEQGYAEVLGQLKAAKMNSLLKALMDIPTRETECVDKNDPFYLDKVDPISVFERWWDEKIKEYPSVEEIKDFLSRVGINSKGYIVYDFSKEEADQLDKRLSVEAMDKREIQNILKASVVKSAHMRAREHQQASEDGIRKKMPLLATGDAKAYVKKLRKLKEVDRLESTCCKLHDIVSAYNLPTDLEALLFEHIDEVCVYSNMTRDDEYRPMLEQFLRFVKDPEERKSVVAKAIDHSWRVLSNGTF